MITSILLKHWKNIALQSEVERVKGKNGELVSRIETHELTISQLKENETRLGLENSNLKDQDSHYRHLPDVKFW